MIRYVWEKRHRLACPLDKEVELSSILLQPYPLTKTLPGANTHTHAHTYSALQTGTPTSTVGLCFSPFSLSPLCHLLSDTLPFSHQFFSWENSRRVCVDDSIIKVQKEQLFHRLVRDKSTDTIWKVNHAQRFWWIGAHHCQAAVTVFNTFTDNKLCTTKHHKGVLLWNCSIKIPPCSTSVNFYVWEMCYVNKVDCIGRYMIGMV